MVTAADVKAYADEHDIGTMEALVEIRKSELLAQRDSHLNNLYTDHPVPSEMAAAIRFLLENMK